MKTAVAPPAETLPMIRSRIADYLELTKPRISVMVLCTVAAGYCLASQGAVELLPLLHTVLATGLIAAGASALNQVMERDSDALMRRTENRPLPAGRISSLEAIGFGLSLGLIGLVYLAVAVAQPVCLLVAAGTFVVYVWIYTPLKKVTTLNTLIGAIPGAAPPLIGWTAASTTVGVDGWIVFFLLFLWQIPHFLAIAWLYRDDYGRAGLKMLPVVDATGAMTGRQMVLYCAALVAVSLLPFLWQRVGVVYLLGAIALGAYFLLTTWRFRRQPDAQSARRVLRASLVYLPVLLVLLLIGYFTRG